MKQCPNCKTNYSDDTLAFCLNDGTGLITLPDSEATQRMSFNPNQIRVDLPSNPSTPTVFANTAPQTIETKKSGKGLSIALLGIALLLLAGAAVAGILLYNNGGFGKTTVTANNSPSPVAPSNSKTEENTQELKDRLANVEKQLSEQKNAKPGSSQTPITKPTQTDSTTTQTTAVAKVAQSNDGYLSLRNEPSAQTGTQILKIPSGSTVELQDCQRNFVVVDNRRGRWCMISYGGYTGWAFDAWLIY